MIDLNTEEDYDVDVQRLSRRERDRSERTIRGITPPRYNDKRWNKVEFEMRQSLERSLDHFRSVKANNATREIKDGLAAALDNPELFGRLQLNFHPMQHLRRGTSPILMVEIEKPKGKAHEGKKSTQLLHDYILRIEMYSVMEVRSIPTQQNKLLLIARGGEWYYFDAEVENLFENERLRALSQEVLFEELQDKFDTNKEFQSLGILLSWDLVNKCLRNLEIRYIYDERELEDLTWELEAAETRSNKRRDRK